MTINNTFSNQKRDENNTFSNLTEQWKKEGSIQENKNYYVKDIRDNIYIDYYWGEGWLNTSNNEIIEVLAPVPSYEEWRSLQSSWVDEMDKATRFKKALDDVCEEYNSKLPILEVENDKLKELLKECRYKIIADLDKARLCKSSVDIEDFEYMLNRIDEVLK